MSAFCSSCKNKNCLITGKPCNRVEKELKKLETGRKNWLSYTDDLVRIEEINEAKREQRGRKLPTESNY